MDQAAALKRFAAEWDDIRAGRKPRPARDESAATVADVDDVDDVFLNGGPASAGALPVALAVSERRSTLTLARPDSLTPRRGQPDSALPYLALDGRPGSRRAGA